MIDINKTNEECSTPQKINMKRCQTDNHTFFVDENGLLKGEWIIFEKIQSLGSKGETLFEIYYSRYKCRIIIDENGLFYNLFSCKKYDAVLRVRTNVFICEKNNRLGLIDKTDKNILHVAYNNITVHNYYEQLLFVVTTETGKFLFNFTKNLQSEVYEDIIVLKEQRNHDAIIERQIIYKKGEKYGLLDADGNVILKPEYYYVNNFWSAAGLKYEFNGFYPYVYVNEGLLYGVMPIDKYDLCLKIEDQVEEYYFVKKDSKIGILEYEFLNKDFKVISEPKYDDIIFYKDTTTAAARIIRNNFTDSNFKWINIIFLICKEGNSYSLINLRNGDCFLSGCKEMKYIKGKDRVLIEFENKDFWGYVTYSGVIVSTKEYDSISPRHHFYFVSKDGKFGLLNLDGKVIAPLQYDSIICDEYGYLIAVKGGKFGVLEMNGKEATPFIYDYIHDKLGSLIAEKDGKETILDFEEESYIEDYYEANNVRPSYGRYAGSYAQDVMGYSDDDIDTIFDGDPSAYWNVD